MAEEIDDLESDDDDDKNYVICEPQAYLLLDMLRNRGAITTEDVVLFLRRAVDPAYECDLRVDLRTGRAVGEDESDG